MVLVCESIFCRTSLDDRQQNLHTFSKVNLKYTKCSFPVGQARCSFHLPHSYNLQILLARGNGASTNVEPCNQQYLKDGFRVVLITISPLNHSVFSKVSLIRKNIPKQCHFCGAVGWGWHTWVKGFGWYSLSLAFPPEVRQLLELLENRCRRVTWWSWHIYYVVKTFGGAHACFVL